MLKSPPAAGTTATRKKILIVDDHPMMREGLRSVIQNEPDMVVCAEVENARQALDAAGKLSPDLALVDITMPGKNGLELVKDLKALHPRLAILAISMHDESFYAERMLRAGASGYITKHQPPEELVKAIRQVLDDRVYVSSEVSEKFLRRFSRQPVRSEWPTEVLTDREFEIFQMIGEGKSVKEIARQLQLSGKTVAVHNANIRQKLNLKTTSQLIRFAVRLEDIDHRQSD
jgi:DNA-binding NarL/FixJ family response regulator